MLHPVAYWAATGVFALLFLGSAALTPIDPDATREATAGFGFPTWVIWWQALAKTLGVIAVLVPRWPTLTGLAFAGFLYDLLLALGAHISQRDLPNIALASFGLVVTAAAYWAYRRRHPWVVPRR